MKPIEFLSPGQIQDLQIQEAQSDKEPKRTPEQIEAIHSSGTNILVSASAGSGKTFVMVQRILDQLHRGISIQQLFISTFTVKAATELKERLEKELEKSLKATQDEELKHHLAQQIAELPTSDIGTMDAFTQRLVSKYGYLLGLSPTFRILQSESEQSLLKNDCFEQVFERFYEEQGPDCLFSRLVKNFTGKSKSLAGFKEQVYALVDFLQSTADPLIWLEESFLKGYQDLDYNEALDQLAQEVKEQLFELESFFTFHLANEGQAFSGAKYQENVTAIQDLIASLNEQSSQEAIFKVLERVVLISRASGGRSLTITTRKEDLKELATAFNDERKERIEALRAAASQHYQLTYQIRFKDEPMPLLVLLRDFVQAFSIAYLERKKQENAFEFGDISHFAIQILEEFPHIRSFYQERYHEVMVDEYQDTNHTQERMLELLSNGHNRFMVGDIKQSIYRFRQADPQIFNDKFKAYQEEGADGKLILLKENFRSHVEVLEATNHVFERLMDEEVGEILYDQSHRLIAGNPEKKEPTPAYETEFLLYDGSQEVDETGEDEEQEGDSLSSGEVLLVIKEIIRLHNEEGVPFKDMTLLTASRTRNDKVLSAFEAYQIPIVADGGEENYLQSVEVMVLLDTLRTINNPLQDYPLVALMKSAMFEFDEDQLARLALQRGEGKKAENLYEKLQLALDQTGSAPQLIDASLKEKLTRFMETLDAWRDYAQTHSLYDLLWKIYQDRHYYDYVGALPNGAQRQANLYALTLRANDFESSSFKGLPRFISMIDKILENQHDLANVAQAVPKDAVQLMTIHKSKGLEFPYVFILNTDKKFVGKELSTNAVISRKNGVGIKYIANLPVESAQAGLPELVRLVIETLPYQRNVEEIRLAALSEQMRLLYVAMTRAERKLYLVGKGRQDKLEEKKWGASVNGRLSPALRKEINCFQDWLYAIQAVFAQQHLAYQTRFVTDQDLTPEQIGHLELKTSLPVDDLKDNRQSEEIRRALDVLESVDRLNTQYQAAIQLPSVRTPSQIKKFYEPIQDMEGVDLMEKADVPLPSFEFPTFGKEEAVTGAAVGSALHELMQRIPLTMMPTMESLAMVLKEVNASPAVKERIDLKKVLAFFQTDLGQLLLKEADKVHREAPFAMLKTDPTSGQDFVVRGILDGYLLLENRILLFDYKTDRYRNPQDMLDRYQAQLELYAEALRHSYGVDCIESYLILLGGEQLQVVSLADRKEQS